MKSPSDIPMISTLRDKTGLDLFNVRVLGLLMCRGEPDEKAGLLFDLIMQLNKEKDPTKRILYWNHPRLRKAIRMLVYISEVLPKKCTQLHQGVGLTISIKQYTSMENETKQNLRASLSASKLKELNVSPKPSSPGPLDSVNPEKLNLNI